uniref:Uncharacterized protein n=1 Tax=Timema genevievae TaxID=629358 RepID=A0A7R9JWV3_TIMGE|nr:unnamed protein product [Timema genevievae]
MKLGMFPQDRAVLKRDGLALFSRLIRTKNVESMQGDVKPGRPEPVGGSKKLKLKAITNTPNVPRKELGDMLWEQAMVQRNTQPDFNSTCLLYIRRPSSPEQDLNIDLPVLGSPAQHETSALANYSTEAGALKLSTSVAVCLLLIVVLYARFQKCLTTLDLTSLGVGSCVGTGMYLVSGMVARNVAGPGVVFSFIIAAVASIFSAAVCNMNRPLFWAFPHLQVVQPWIQLLYILDYLRIV